MKALPSIFTARAAYTQFCLFKLSIATTAVGNMYGLFMDPQSLQVESYLGRMIEAGDRYAAMNPEGAHDKILQSAPRLREWLWNYNACHSLESTATTSSLSACLALEEKDIDWATNDIEWMTLVDGNEISQIGFEDLFGPF